MMHRPLAKCVRSCKCPQLLTVARSPCPTGPSIVLRLPQFRHAHGVYKGLTESRIQEPWITALRRREAEGLATPKSPGERDMRPRKMSDSYHEVELPLAREPWLSDTYLNASGRIRLGALFMDLDALAGIISYKHTGEEVTVVTAAVDRITIENPPSELCDLVYSGQVTYATGRSSMEVTCRVSRKRSDGKSPQDEDHFLTCMFTMVTLDPATKKSTAIPPLQPSTPTEQHLFNLGAARSTHKKSLAQQTLLQNPPNAAESALIHALWLRSRQHKTSTSTPSTTPSCPSPSSSSPTPITPTTLPMSATTLSNTSIMQPRHRNRHQFQIFGGYLLRHAYELAFSCCANFAHTRPTFVSLDPSRFLNPVPVGSVLYLTAVVAFTDPGVVGEGEVQGLGEGSTAKGVTAPGSSVAENEQEKEKGERKKKQTKIQIRVDSKVRTIEHGYSKPTGQFNYTFMVDADVRVMPETYREFMVYVDAFRRVRDMGSGRDGGVDGAAGMEGALAGGVARNGEISKRESEGRITE